MSEWKFKKVEFLYELKLNLLLEIGLEDMYEEANIHYWKQLGKPHEEDLINMDWQVESCNKEEQTIILKITGYIEDKGE